MRLAVIPARGGSKRIPRKNVKLFCGKPIIAWSIETALRSGCFEQVIVSTDDNEVANIARQFGAKVPFLRPPELADDYAGTIPVVAHAIAWYAEHEALPIQVCCIYPTAPFIQDADLRQGLEILKQNNCDYVLPITHYPSPIQRAMRITAVGRVEMFNSEQFNKRSQDLELSYHDVGQFYWGRTEPWLIGKPIFSANTIPLILPCYRVLDIDTPDDWKQAEWLFQALKNTPIEYP